MNPVLNRYRSPEPPPELRGQVFEALRKQLSINQHSWIDRIWMNRKLRISWLAAVIVLTFFLTFWNPPAQSSSENLTGVEAHEKDALDPFLLRWLDEASLDEMLARNQKETLETEDL